jgi:phospholipid-binding lipoprotein MlaA
MSRVPVAAPGRAAAALIVLTGLFVSGCASQSASRQPVPGDPLEPVNRGVFAFNDFTDTYLLRPVASGYAWLFPQFMRTGVNNFFENLAAPVDILNAFLQAKPRQGFSDAARMGLNTTVGIGGLFDPATTAGLALHDEDFGQTLGVWGVPEGPYLVIPFFGPRTARSGGGQLVDLQYHPQLQFRGGIRSRLNVLWIIHQRSRLLAVDEQIQRAFDPYAFVRDAYLQNRRFLRYDGMPPEEAFPEEDFDDEFADAANARIDESRQAAAQTTR